MSNLLTTQELKIFIKKQYNLIEEFILKNNIHYKFNIYFMEKMPKSIEGTYVYSDLISYHYIVAERGKIQLHQITDSLFDVSYLIFKEIIFQISVEYEVKHRNNNQDFRRILFKINLMLWGLLGKDYKKRREDEINEILKDAPYDDNNT